MPRDLSIVRPGSACPGCGTAISARDNIPVLSWLLLRGRCRSCGEPISGRYPLVEGLNAVLWLVLAWWAVGPAGVDGLLRGSSCSAVPAWPCGSSTSSTTGCRTRSCCRCIRLARSGWCSPGSPRAQWPVSAVLIGVGAWLAVIGGIWLLTGGRAMGFGDVKLAPVLAATLGWVGVSSALVGLLAAFVLGGGVGLVLMLTGRARRGSHMAFGPFLLLGALVGLLWGEVLGSAYLDFIGL